MPLKKMQRWLKISFLLLLPLFFVFHGFTENYNAIPLVDALSLLSVYTLASIVIFLIAYFFYPNLIKAALLSFFLVSFHFFFGALQDFLKLHFEELFITRYSFLIPFFIVAFVSIIILLKKTKKTFTRFSFYLNVLFCLLILIDIIHLGSKILHRSKTNDFASGISINCTKCPKPDIYFLVFDEYSSTSAIREVLRYDNVDLDNFLQNKGFRLLPNSRSNYNFTEFSIASTLNMDFLQLSNPSTCTVKDYNYCFELIKSNMVCTILSSMDYDIVNYSIFDLPKNPTPIKEDFLPLKTKLITSQTLISRIKKDLFYHLVIGRFEIKWLAKNLIYTTYYSNEKVINGTLKTPTVNSDKPKFVYAHVEMPHPPFYYDKFGREKSKAQVVKDTREMKLSSYLDYLPKTNQVIKQIVNKIFGHSKRPFAIVLMGDHGYRERQDSNFQFRNLNAVYISSHNYSGFYDSITNVNEYRVLFNNLFNASLPLKKDSCIFLKDKN